MAPSNPKRPPRPPRPPGTAASKKEEVELPFDDDEVAPLQEDDPRPQRVPQFPAGPRRAARGPLGARPIIKDHEMSTRFDTNEYSDPGHVPAFLYVEKGPGAGQLIPVKQGPLVIGRASACDLRLQHPSISRRHAQIVRQGERFVLRDLGSQNGTFVNRVKASAADMEIRVGDEITLGNAVLKLRGSGVLTDKDVPQKPIQIRLHTRGTSLMRVAVLAAAMGSAVAALLTVAFLKFLGPGRPVTVKTDSATASAPTNETAPPAQAAPAQLEEDDYLPPPPASAEETASAPAQAEASPRALTPVQPKAEAPARAETRSPSPKASALGSKSSASRKEPVAKASARPPPRQETASEPARVPEKAPTPPAPPAPKVASADVMALYEKGDVDGALKLARSGQLEPLAAKITAFQNAMAAGQKSLDAKDTSSAIQRLAAALAMDQELSQGWSVQGRTLRRQLGKLYTQIGQEQLKAGAKDSAREAFEMALQYDPANTWAKTELQGLGPKP